MVKIFKMSAESLCWWFFKCIESVLKILNRSPVYQSCRKLSPTPVTNNDVTCRKENHLGIIRVLNELRTSWPNSQPEPRGRPGPIVFIQKNLKLFSQIFFKWLKGHFWIVSAYFGLIYTVYYVLRDQILKTIISTAQNESFYMTDILWFASDRSRVRGRVETHVSS